MPMSRRNSGYTRSVGWTAVTAVALVALLSACGNKEKKIVLEGERKAIVELNDVVTPDEALKAVPVTLPQPYANPEWPQAGGYPNHAMHHLALGASPRIVWRANVEGSTSNRNLVSQPVVAQGMVFALGSGWEISAFNADSGSVVWRQRLKAPKDKEKEDTASGGGIAYDNGKIYVTLGTGEALALDSRTGGEVWRVKFDVALRGAPTASEGFVYVTTHDNQLYALNAETGANVWQHVAIAEAAGLVGSASPAVIGGTVVAAFSSGELFALQSSNGRVAWADSLTRVGRMTALSTLNDIDGSPVIDRGSVFAVGHSGRMAAIDLTTGSRLWENDVPSAQTLWVAGDYIFVVTADNQLMCLSRRTGKAKWVTDMLRYKKNNKKKALITWTGPVLAGDRLLVVTNNGMLASFSPYTGEFLGGIEIPSKKNYIEPVVANGTLYLMGDDGELLAMR